MNESYQSSQSTGSTQKARSLSALASFVTDRFNENVRFRQISGMDKELLECKYAAVGEYTPDEKARRLSEGLPIVYAPLSGTKCRSAKAWANEIFLNSAEKIYEIHATPVPDMPANVEAMIAESVIKEWAAVVSPNPPQTEQEFEAIRIYAEQRRDELDNLIKEEAEKRAARLDRIVHDKLVEGRFREEMTSAIDYAATYGTAVVKLVNRIRKRPVRSVNKYGVSSFKAKFEARLELQALDPMDCYPSKGAREVGEGHFCQRVRFLPYDLSAMIGNKGYMDDALREIIHAYSSNGYRTYLSTDSENETLNNDGVTSESISTIEGVEFWGTVLGRILIDSGVYVDPKGNKISANDFYDVNCIVIAGLMIYCEMVDPVLGRPLFKGTFYDSPGSWWGVSPISKMRDVQRLANGALTSLSFNMAMCAGPQVAITDISRLRDKDLSVRPWRYWLFDKPTNGNTADVPIKFFQPNSNASELIGIYDRMVREADNLTGIPAYSYGSDVAAGAGRTASGLSMLMDAAQRGMKHVIFSLDLDLMRPILTYLVYSEMMTSNDEGIKGDVTIDAGGILAVLTKDKTMEQLHQVLALCQNPLVARVVGDDGIAEILRRMVCLIPNINPDRIVPTREEIEFRNIKAQLEQIKMQQMQQQMALRGQIDAARAGVGGMNGQQQPHGVPLQDGIAPPHAAVGGQIPGSTVNQYQPNSVPQGMEMVGAA